MGNCWSCLGRTIRKDRQEERGQFQQHQYRTTPLRIKKQYIQSTKQVPLGRTIKNDRQGEAVQSSQENPEDEPIPSTSSEQQTSSSQTHGGEVSVVKLRSRNESIKFSELTPVEEPLPSTTPEHQSSTSPEHQSSTPQTPGGEVSVVKVRSRNESIKFSELTPVEQPLLSTSPEHQSSTFPEYQPSTPQTPGGEVSVVKHESIQSKEQVLGEQPIPSSSYSSEFQPPTSQTLGGESSFNISYSVFVLSPFLVSHSSV